MNKILRENRYRVACAGAVLTFCLSPVAVHAGDIHALVRDKAGKAIADAVVVASPASRTGASPGGISAAIMVDQVNKEFVPYVLPVRVGTTVNFPNKDNIRHHVYSFSPAKNFELPLVVPPRRSFSTNRAPWFLVATSMTG